MSDELIGTIAVFLIALLANWWSNHGKIKELQIAQEKLQKQYLLDSKKADPEIASTYLTIAQTTGDQVITRDNKIAKLETSLEEVQKIVNGLILDKSRLESESAEKDKKITELTNRVEFLEKFINEKDWPLPPVTF